MRPRRPWRNPKNAITEMEKNVSNKITAIQKAKDEAVEAEENLARLQTEYQNMCAGISSEEGDEGDLCPTRSARRTATLTMPRRRPSRPR